MGTLDELRELYKAMPLDRLRDAAADGEASYRAEAWQIIQEEIRQRRVDGRWPAEDESEGQDAALRVSPTEQESLTGVGGWLAFFVVAIALSALGSIVQGFAVIRGGENSEIGLLLLLWVPVLSYGLNLIFSRDARAPRYWIVVMVVQAVFSVAIGAMAGDARGSGGSILGSLVWAMYWAKSRRVRQTFAASQAPPSPAVLGADLAPATNGSSTTTPSVGQPSAAVPAPDMTPSGDTPERELERDEPWPAIAGYSADQARPESSRAVASGQARGRLLPLRARGWVALSVVGLVVVTLLAVGSRQIMSLGNPADAASDARERATASAPQPLTPREIAERARAATVQIRALDARGIVIGQGTGFLLSKHGLVSTNLHVIRRAHALQVETLSGDTYDLVFYVTGDARRDVAVLKIPVDDGRPLPLSLDTAIAVGERVYVMGNPLGQTGTFSDGLVSANRAVDGVSLIQITAPVSPGSSGGPVLNALGEVIGMATLMLREGQNLNYAVPVRYIRPLLETGESPRRYEVGLLPRPAGGLSSIGVINRGAGGGNRRGSRGAAPARTDDVVGTQFLSADSAIRSVGGEVASPIRRGSLAHGGSNSHELVLTQGREYAIVGYCDEDCRNLDLAVSTPAGTEAASDVRADDKPTLMFTAPVSGTYRLEVTMASCSIAPCAYGVRLYRF